MSLRNDTKPGSARMKRFLRTARIVLGIVATWFLLSVVTYNDNLPPIASAP